MRAQPEKGGSYNPKKGKFRTNFIKKKRVLGTEAAKRGSWELIYLLSLLLHVQYDQLVGVCSGRLKKGGS